MEKKVIQLSWLRDKLFDQYITAILYEHCFSEDMTAKVVQVQRKNKAKWRPLPLNTIEFSKLATQKLKMTSHRAMEIAEKLYNKGYISYPRTETEIYNKEMDIKKFIAVQQSNQTWGDYARTLCESKFQVPRKGKKDDQSHPPIHPI